MDWLSADNIVAVLTALLSAVVPPAVAVVYRRRVRRGRRIGYRVQMDTPIGSDHRHGPGQPSVRLGLFHDLPDMSDGTLVLLRVENDGGESISESDYTGRDPLHGLTVVFTDRIVRGAALTQLSAEHLTEYFAAPGALRHTSGTLHLPRMPLDQGQHFKLLVLLSGGRVGSPVRVSGGIRDGAVVPNRSTTVDDKPPVLSRPARGITALLTAGVLTLAGVIVLSGQAPPMGCATGQLTLVGSTAFSPVLHDLAEEYGRECPGASVQVDTEGSYEGVRELAGEDGPAGGGGSALIAFSDGPKPGGYPELVENRVAVAAFAIVVNAGVPVRDLTLAQIRGMYRGDILDWSAVHGPRLPVRLVSRRADSGTRELFQRRVLDTRPELTVTSRDCRTSDTRVVRGIRCELRDTDEVLRTVAQVSGAIGYAELRAAQDTKGVRIIGIGGRVPTPDDIRDRSYPFADVEYAYTRGRPAEGSLAAGFLDFAVTGGGQRAIRAGGHLPCYSPEGFARCATP
ncbi:PstS family phosphate ABC transporter substrate-binding protein [Streptacidiphilus griseoplanus]|uniref:PstS family phosphate ABC transporter substrate-binding protein n=1 Tax=Peterkaempfera griseoplana TaxID=66896 RepID=UPI0006E3E674|nr:substrate-binding domain-containing protein [Peterkaempfera griseoplana]